MGRRSPGGRSDRSRLLVHTATRPENPTRVALGLLVGRSAIRGGIATIGAGRAARFKDPDGNLLAVLQFDEDV